MITRQKTVQNFIVLGKPKMEFHEIQNKILDSYKS